MDVLRAASVTLIGLLAVGCGESERGLSGNREGSEELLDPGSLRVPLAGGEVAANNGESKD